MFVQVEVQFRIQKFQILADVRITISVSVADPDPGSFAFLPPGSGIRIRDEFFPDLGSRIPDPRGMFLVRCS
jgi:hypothetical protein